MHQSLSKCRAVAPRIPSWAGRTHQISAGLLNSPLRISHQRYAGIRISRYSRSRSTRQAGLIERGLSQQPVVEVVAINADKPHEPQPLPAITSKHAKTLICVGLLVAQPHRDIPVTVEHPPDVDVIVLLDVKDQVGIALERLVTAQHAGGGDGVVGAAHHVQTQAELADAGFAGAQPAEQRGVLGVVVQAVGGQAQAHVRSDEGGATSLA